jgi:MFS family permease
MVTGKRFGRTFGLVWLAHSISELGTQVSLLALPLTAAVVLDAGAWQMGLLTAAGLVPYPLLALPLGAVVDRLPHRGVLVLADVARAVLLGSIPIAALTGTLTLGHLCAVAFLTGGFTVLFDLARTSLVPLLLAPEHLVSGNSRFALSGSAAQVGGPGLGAALVQVLSAPLAITVDAVSFLLSAALLRRVPHRTRSTRLAVRDVGRDVLAGIRFVAAQPVLRTLALAMGAVNLFGLMTGSIMVLYGLRELDLSPGLVGALIAMSGVGALAGAMTATWIGRRVGLGWATIIGATFYALAPVLLPFATNDRSGLVLFGAAQLLLGCGVAILDVNALTLRQLSTPDDLQGRTGATIRLVQWGAKPLGALLGGFLGTAIGLRSTVWLAVAGGLLSIGWLCRSPLRGADVEARSPVPGGVS